MGKKSALLLPAVILTTVISQSPAFADAFGLSSAGQAEKYGINYPTEQEMPGASLTTTSHHRYGNQTGIGSSTLQTEANTAEAMSRVQYTPTANAPLTVTQTTAPDTTPTFHLFSHRMISIPALHPSVTGLPSLSQMVSPGMSSVGSLGTNFNSSWSDSSLNLPILQNKHRELETHFLHFDDSLNQL
ncbi:MAG TPA: hypothetical protein V6C81_05160 [Planktothrix sp.]